MSFLYDLDGFNPFGGGGGKRRSGGGGAQQHPAPTPVQTGLPAAPAWARLLDDVFAQVRQLLAALGL